MVYAPPPPGSGLLVADQGLGIRTGQSLVGLQGVGSSEEQDQTWGWMLGLLGLEKEDQSGGRKLGLLGWEKAVIMICGHSL